MKPNARNKRRLVLGTTALLAVSGVAAFGVVFHTQANAESLLVTCTAKTQEGVIGMVLTDSTSCSVPSGATITRARLESVLDDGGEIYINGQQVFSLPPTVGVDANIIDIPTSLFSAGQSFNLEVIARNATDGNGNPIGPVYGRATLEIFGDQGGPPPVPTPTADIKANGQDGPITIQSGTSATISWTSNNATSCSVSPTGWSGTSGSQSTGGLTSSQTYTLNCTGPGGNATDSVTVNVQATVQPPSQPTVSGLPSCSSSSYTATISWSGTPNPSYGFYVDISTDNFNTFWNKNVGNANSTQAPSGFAPYQGSLPTLTLQPGTAYQVRIFNGAHSPSASFSVPVCANQPTADIKANGQDGPVTIQSGQSATISWTSQNATSCSVSPTGWTGTSGSQSTGNLTASQTYTLNCSGPGGSAVDSVTVNIQAGNVTADIKANGQDGPITIQSGTSATISWISSNATSCSVSPTGWSGTSGSQSTGGLTSSQTYTLNCTGPGGNATDSVTVNVQAGNITADIKANGQDGPVTIQSGQSATISWTSQNATSCMVTPGSWSGTSGSQSTGNLTNSQTYTVNCTGPGGNATDSVTINVQAGNVTADIKANGQDGPVTVTFNSSATISWTSQNATTCSVSPTGWTGTSGSQSTGNLASSQTYTLTCNGPGGSATDSVTVNVSNAPQVTADIKANNQDGPITINFNAFATITWTSTNATTCSVSPTGWTGASGSQSTGNLTFSQTYFLNCSGQGGTATDSVVVNVGNVPQVTADIKANGSDGPVNIDHNASATLTWTSQNATSCTVFPSGFTGTSGSQSTGALTSSRTYTVQCAGAGGSGTDSVTINVNQPPAPTVTLAASPTTITQGQSSVLTWSSTNATTCSAAGGWSGTKNLSGSETINPFSTTAYTIVCQNQTGQQVQANATVTVSVVQNQPTLTLNANPTSISQGGSSILTWTSTNTTSCTASGGWSGSRNVSGNETVFPAQTTTYSMNCSGSGGSVSAQATVFVSAFQPTVNLATSPSSIAQGQSSILTWTSANAAQCTASGGWSGSKALSGSEQTSPSLTTTYSITCSNQNGVANDSETVFVTTTVGTPARLLITKAGLNRTLNQTAYSNSIEAQGGDTVEFEIRVRNTDTSAGQITVRDILPQELSYVPGSTTINNNVAPDGIAASGLSLGTVASNEEKAIRFRATVLTGTTPRTTTNQISATMNAGVSNAFATVNVRPRGQVLGVADIVTGPEDALPWIFLIGFVSSIASYFIIFKYGLVGGLGPDPETQFNRTLAAIRRDETLPDTESGTKRP